MKQILLICFLTITLIVSSGCKTNTLNVDQKKPTNTSSAVNSLKESVTQSKQAVGSSSIGKNSPKERDVQAANEDYFGTWVIKRDITSGQASIHSKEDIDKLLGKTITYSEDLASFFDNKCKNPNYNKVSLSENEFFENFYVSFERLGITRKAVDVIDVYTNEEFKYQWNSVGSTIIVKDANTLILFDGGEFFIAERLKL